MGSMVVTDTVEHPFPYLWKFIDVGTMGSVDHGSKIESSGTPFEQDMRSTQLKATWLDCDKELASYKRPPASTIAERPETQNQIYGLFRFPSPSPRFQLYF